VRQAVIALVLVASAAIASPVDDLANARTAFRNRDYDSAIKSLTALLYPHEQLADPNNIVEARVLLGVSDFETDRPEDARTEFEKALQLDPNKTLDTLSFSTGAVHLFDETRQEIEQRKAREAEIRKLQEKNAAAQKYLESLRVYEVHSYALNFVPFGAGQFQNHDRFKGFLLAGAQGLTLSGSVGTWLFLISKYGVNCPHCVSQKDADSVLMDQRIQIGLGATFFALYFYGVVDALRHYTPRAEIKGDSSLLPPDLRRPAKKTSLLDKIHIAPMATQSGVGLGVGWEN
jgi:tetratricopeptide (TPR) repeat protein